MSSEVLVTVFGTARRGDVCLDDEVPVGSLVVDLGRHYGDSVDGELVLTDDRGEILDPGASLRDLGVTHGDKLTLRSRAEAQRLAESSLMGRLWSRRSPTIEDQVGELAEVQPVVAPPLEVQALQTPAPAPTRTTDRSDNAIQRTRVLLPEHCRVTHRLRRAVSASLGRNAGQRMGEFRAGRTTPSPAELTLPAAPGPIARWRRAWEDTDYLHRLDQAIARPQLARCATVAVVSPKGGVGKTTTTALLGTLVAHLRRDLVLAIDANPDYGSLGRVLCPDNVFFVDDIVARLNASIPSMADLNAWLGAGPHGLRVLPAPTDPARMSRIGFEVYSQVIRRMKDYAGMLLVDCGTGIHEAAAQAALAGADQVVIVSDADPATASLVSEAASRMPKCGPLTLVVNKMPHRGSRLDLNRLAETLPGVDTMVVIPAEPKAASTLGLGAFTWSGVPASWQRAVRELAAVLIAGWPALGLERS
jgi:MinD-like ATPase involved in chromosome partitioning or flagellar assembly